MFTRVYDGQQSWILGLHVSTRKEKGLKIQKQNHSKMATLYLVILYYFL